MPQSESMQQLIEKLPRNARILKDALGYLSHPTALTAFFERIPYFRAVATLGSLLDDLLGLVLWVLFCAGPAWCAEWILSASGVLVGVPDTIHRLFILLPCVIPGSVLTWFVMTSKFLTSIRAAARYVAEYRHPVDSRPDLCESAIVWLAYPDVMAWRDAALEERETLTVLDVLIMRELFLLAKDEEEESGREAKRREACQRLHTLTQS